jgi:Zn-dependent metalloprotease
MKPLRQIPRLALTFLLMALLVVPAMAQDSVQRGIDRLTAVTGNGVDIRRDDLTGSARFVRLQEGRLTGLSGSTPEARAMSFFKTHGDVFGIDNAKHDLVLQGVRSGETLTHVSYDQMYQDVPVFGATLRAHFALNGELVAVNGTFLPKLSINTTPSLDSAYATKLAIRQVAGLEKASLRVAAQDLLIFQAGLLQGIPGSTHLVYRMEVLNDARTVREFVFVDAHTGIIVEQITGIYHALNREVSETSLANVVWTEGDPNTIPAGWAGGSAQQVVDWQDEIDASLETYNVFASMTNGSYVSYDGASATMRTVNNDPNISCPNANWNGISTNYCTGVTGDDTVAHEWGHAYTQFTNDLIYQWQSGALNESYSDIWGEVIDFVNGRGSDSPGGLRDSAGRYCSSLGSGRKRRDNSYRWLSGEDDPAFNGAIRDLWRPSCYGDPGEVSASQYHCATSDAGGVHTNSGVPNHGFALITDGGSWNGQTISGIGLTKAARLHWEAQNLLVPSSNFVDHADALETACTALTGATLYELDATSPNGTVSADVISAADCAEVTKVIAAVEFRTLPTQCNFQPLLSANAPALCGGDTVIGIHSQDWESGLGAWTVGTRAVVNPGTFSTADWAAVSGLPAGRAGSAAFVEDILLGDCVNDIEAGALFLDSPVINIPGAASSPAIAFDHYVATEASWDGGNVKVSVNGGGFSLVSGSAFSFNGYNSSLETVANGNDNPLAGEAAFTGTDGGETSGSWGQSQIDLNGIASGGDDIQIRFELGLDGCGGLDGWYVDEVNVHSCSGPPPPSCDNDGVCESGEDCNNCPNDCSGVSGGKPSNRYCCGDGTIQSAETSALCDGNF